MVVHHAAFFVRHTYINGRPSPAAAVAAALGVSIPSCDSKISLAVSSQPHRESPPQALLSVSPPRASTIYVQAENPFAFEAMMIPMMTPNNPSALPKISTTRILTNSSGFCASESAQLEPATPTHIPHARLENPTFTPAAKRV
jgi:hypothetical protein